MIDPKSLRIGNWVHTSNGHEQVCDVLCDSINTATIEGETLGCIDPIPLSAIILEEAGCTLITKTDNIDVYAVADSDIRMVFVHGEFIELAPGKWYIEARYGWIETPSLHWLQNYYYFAISGGRELDIKL